MKNRKKDLTYLAQLAMLICIQMVMRAMGLGSVPVGPLNMSFLTLPIAVGAITLGPLAGAVLGGVFGAYSLYDAITGKSVMTGIFFNLNPVSTFVLCVVMRVLMGLCTGLIFTAIRNYDKKHTWSYLVGSVAAPVLNTIFFMGYICMFFYGTEYVQGLVAKFGATNPVMFVVLLVGVQGLAEACVCGLVGAAVCKALSVAFRGRVAFSA